MPPQTLVAFRDHGIVERTVDRNLDDAERVMSRLDAAGISMSAVTDKLLGEGLASFQRSFDSLVAGLARKRESLGHNLVPNS